MKYFIVFATVLLLSCSKKKDTNQRTEIDSSENIGQDISTIYFLLTDRFYNGNAANDFKDPPGTKSAPYRSFMGGDVAGITQKINQGYFDSLGVQAIWMTPLVENVAGSVDEGTGLTYAYHGYWTKDWTSFDSRTGSAEEIREMVAAAHLHHIKVIFDVVANHTGPVTSIDPKWPDEWVKTGPKCVYKDYETTVNCTLVDNLPDIRTESRTEVDLPEFLIEKWKKEGRYDQEINELNAFFSRTKYPRQPVYYIIKWLTDMISDFGIDGYRVDTAKHTEEEVWKNLREQSDLAFDNYKHGHPEEKGFSEHFYMVGEVYNYYISGGRDYDYGDKKVDFFSNGFDALINFDFKSDAGKPYEKIFSKYDTLLFGPLKGKTVLNYVSSHDDGGPFDIERKKTMESGTKLLLTQGQAQIYYGDESARSLTVSAEGDARLRSFMNWEEQQSPEKQMVLNHWRKLGLFRKNHISIGAGKHRQISESPYVFSRIYPGRDTVIVALDYADTDKKIDCKGIFSNGTAVRDAYSGIGANVENGIVSLKTNSDIVLLEKIK